MINTAILKSILNQFGGPIKIDCTSISHLHITNKLVTYHIQKIDDINNYTISELFSLYHIIEFALKNLGVDEFNTVTGYDLYNDGYKLLTDISKLIVK